MTSSKNTGFSIAFGTDPPFNPDDAIIGGGSKPITVKAQNPGCYKYDAGSILLWGCLRYEWRQQARVGDSALT
jgi:hypothetical protein